jgi:cyclopropane fatty-acyl-phospholipid synthase-like methyltransferase
VELNTSAPAERNKQPIVDALAPQLAACARVLEIASGTGQHVVHFAAHWPAMAWQPTDRGAEDLAQIAARRADSGLPNIATPLRLDVLDTDWQVPHDFDAVVCINMIHISPWETTAALFAGAARHLRAPGPGLVTLYGPFREGGRHTAPSNEEFERWLKSKDERFAVRNLEDVDAVATDHGFARRNLQRMPANNLLLVFQRRV